MDEQQLRALLRDEYTRKCFCSNMNVTKSFIDNNIPRNEDLEIMLSNFVLLSMKTKLVLLSTDTEQRRKNLRQKKILKKDFIVGTEINPDFQHKINKICGDSVVWMNVNTTNKYVELGLKKSFFSETNGPEIFKSELLDDHIECGYLRIHTILGTKSV